MGINLSLYDLISLRIRMYKMVQFLCKRSRGNISNARYFLNKLMRAWQWASSLLLTQTLQEMTTWFFRSYIPLRGRTSTTACLPLSKNAKLFKKYTFIAIYFATVLKNCRCTFTLWRGTTATIKILRQSSNCKKVFLILNPRLLRHSRQNQQLRKNQVRQKLQIPTKIQVNLKSLKQW